MWVGMWHGGPSYASPSVDDLERFESLVEASSELVRRERYGRGSFRYVFRPAESVDCPAVSESSMWLYSIEPSDLGSVGARESLRRHLEADGYPDRVVELGPRGGVRRTV